MKNIKLEKSWKDNLSNEFSKEYWEKLTNFIREKYQTEKIYPSPKKIFHAFDSCPFNDVKVVIIGQDPYHGASQANGLCFAVNKDVPLPPSLQNIFKEIKSDLKIEPQECGDLSRWANQGVLMLNSVLTVKASSPASHRGRGWELFTDATIKVLNQNRKNIVYILWGRYAQEKGKNIDYKNNLVLKSGHPSPFSAHLFFNKKHFSKTNDYLKKYNLGEIDWR